MDQHLKYFNDFQFISDIHAWVEQADAGAGERLAENMQDFNFKMIKGFGAFEFAEDISQDLIMWFLYEGGLRGIKYEGAWGNKTPIIFFIRARCKIWSLSNKYTDWYKTNALTADGNILVNGEVSGEEYTLNIFMRECGAVYSFTPRETEIFTYVVDGIDNHYSRALWGAYIAAARHFGVSKDFVKEVIQSCQHKVKTFHTVAGVPYDIWGEYFKQVEQYCQDINQS